MKHVGLKINSRAVLARPEDRAPAVLEERALPRLRAGEQRVLVDVLGEGMLPARGLVGFEEGARLGAEGGLTGGVAKVHGREN